MSKDRDLEHDIFGGSDSEFSSEEEEAPQKAPARRKAQAPAANDYESSSGDDYKKPPEAKRRRTKDRNEDGTSTRRKTTTSRRKEPVEVDWDSLPPDQAAKMRMEARIDAILKPKKAARPKKRKKGAEEEEVLDRYADEEVSRLRETMLTAAIDDDNSNKEKLPATAKLRLLPQVMEVLRKASLAQSIVDNNLLEGVRRWLEPLPDASLPTLNIQRDFFPVLKRMEYIDSAVLKESGLGRVILFYTKCKRVTPEISRIAQDLVSTWSRPIIKRSASYRDRVVPTSQEPSGAQRPEGSHRVERLNAILARAKDESKGRVKRNAVMIPQRELGNYTVAPRLNGGISRQNASVDVDIERRRKNADRLRSLTKKVANKQS